MAASPAIVSSPYFLIIYIFLLHILGWRLNYFFDHNLFLHSANIRSQARSHCCGAGLLNLLSVLQLLAKPSKQILKILPGGQALQVARADEATQYLIHTVQGTMCHKHSRERALQLKNAAEEQVALANLVTNAYQS